MPSVTSCSMLMTVMQAIALVSATQLVAKPARAQGSTSPVAFKVAYARIDGKPFDDGRLSRTYGITRSWSTRTQWLTKISTYPQFTPHIDELANEADYGTAMSDWANERSTRSPLPPQGSVAGTRWMFNSIMVEFKKNGQAVMGSRTGRWSQSGNVVRWSAKGLYGYVYNYAGEVDHRTMTTYVSADNLRSSMFGKKTHFIDGLRVE